MTVEYKNNFCTCELQFLLWMLEMLCLSLQMIVVAIVLEVAVALKEVEFRKTPTRRLYYRACRDLTRPRSGRETLALVESGRAQMMFDFAVNCRQFTAILIAYSRILLYITLSFYTKLSTTSIMHPVPKKFSQRNSWAFLGRPFKDIN